MTVADVTRRRALMLLAGLGGIALLPVRMARGAELPASLAEFAGRLDAETAARLGRSYLERHPGNADTERLVDALLQDLEGPTDLPILLSRKAREDFAEGHVVELEDWQVSETEALVFAAIAMIA